MRDRHNYRINVVVCMATGGNDNYITEKADAIRALGATALYVFGSTVRDEATAESAPDLFIDYDQRSRFSLVELVGIKQLLERSLGVAVDVTTRDSLDPLLRDRIETSAQQVF